MVNATSKSTRLIGSYQLHPHIIPLPSTMSLPLTDDDEFIVLANAAFWTHISYEEAVSHIQHISNAKMAASKLRDMSLAYGNKEEVSVIVIYLNSRHSASRQILSTSDGENKGSPLLYNGSHMKRSRITKLSRPKTFHGEEDLHYSTASLGRTKQATVNTTDIIEPSLKHSHSKSVKEIYKPAATVEQQPKPNPKSKVITSSEDNYTSPQTEAAVKKRPLQQNEREWKTAAKNDTIDNHHTKTSIAKSENPPVKQTQPQFKTSQNYQTKPPLPDPQVSSHNPQLLSHDPQLLSHDFPSLSHASSHSTVAGQSTETQSLNESANPTWFESLPPMELGDSYGNDTFGLELGMLSGMMPHSTDSNVVLGKRDVDQTWGTRTRSYTQPQSSMRNIDDDRERAKDNFNFDELLAGLNSGWMAGIPSFPENSSPTGSNYEVPAKSTMAREDSLFLDNSAVMEQFDQPTVDDKELNDLIAQLSDFVHDTN